jgi:disulfide bond formation protein DsbB
MKMKTGPFYQPSLYSAQMMIGGLAVLVWAAVLGGQYGFGLSPCQLCLYQRWPWAVVFGLAILVAIWRQNPSVLAVCGGLMAVTLLVGAGIAGYHHGVEQHWWRSAVECSTGLPAARDFESFKAAMLNRPVVACDKIPWSFAGLSMASYNFILSLICAAGLAGVVIEKTGLVKLADR